MIHFWQTHGLVLVCSALAVVPAALVVKGLVAWRRRHGIPQPVAIRRSVAEVAAVVGTAPWVVMTMQPSATGVRHVNLQPLHDLLTLRPGAVAIQLVGNLMVFAAAGFFLPIRFRVFASVWHVLAAAAACSTVIEILQYVLNIGRVSSVDDVLINAAGAGLAAACSAYWWRPCRSATPAPLAG